MFKFVFWDKKVNEVWLLDSGISNKQWELVSNFW